MRVLSSFSVAHATKLNITYTALILNRKVGGCFVFWGGKLAVMISAFAMLLSYVMYAPFLSQNSHVFVEILFIIL